MNESRSSASPGARTSRTTHVPEPGWMASTNWIDAPGRRAYRWTATYDGERVLLGRRRMGISRYEHLQILTPDDIHCVLRLFSHAGFV